jgi:GNAT superfamily N-acetyltransferase
MAVHELVVHEAAPAELDTVRALLARANEQFRSVLDPAAFEPYLAMVLDVEGRADAASVLVARIDGHLAGTVTFFPDAADEGWGADAGTSGLRAMAVDPHYRGAGLGRSLVDACVLRSRAVGSAALALHTATWLADAIRLYERCGFVRDPAADHRASDLMSVPPHADYVALAYRLNLGP